ncbi:MAG: SpoIID/LytB domain-containing protein [Spirochaetes bacterium]|nr:SpoIID/LytB domain-containing protein [Spirochaetota bacterium]
MIKTIIPFLIFICLTLSLFSDDGTDYNRVRVLVFKAEKIDLKLEGDFQLINLLTKQMIAPIRNDRVSFHLKEGKIKIENVGLFSGMIQIKNIKGIIHNGKYAYTGDFYIVSKTNTLLAINDIDVEEYLKGVLPNEISPKWNQEAIKAQAVAARTFAYFYKLKNADQPYHLSANTLSQVYSGQAGQIETFAKAIKETEGEILVLDNKLIAAYFHSVCGGHTESAEKVWGRKVDYLTGVPCNYCRQAKYYRWEVSYTEEEVIRKLKKSGFDLSGISDIRGAQRSSSGRWISLKIRGKPKDIMMNGNTFRLILGAEKLRSTKFVIRRVRDGFKFMGRGWGHGVGMCQWGARGMAERGYKYYQILRYYFRRTKLVKIHPRYLRSQQE